MYSKKLLSTVAFMIILMFVACKQDSAKAIEGTDLEGKWEVFEAYRGKKVTETLNGAYFIFKNNELTVNITGRDVTAPYTLTGTKIEHQTTNKERYEISGFVNDNMMLNTTLSDYDFRFNVKKVEE